MDDRRPVPSQNSKRHVGRRLLLVITVIFLLLGPAIFNVVVGAVLQLRYPVPGAFYQVDGHSMHLYCTGAGSPTVLLEAGGGNDWLIWQKVQQEIANTTRVCSYDRAGVGWSAPQPGLLDAKRIADELHSLLQDAGEQGPLVLVGASVGGFYVRQFAASYPKDVAGLVFVDSSTPEQIVAVPGSAYSPELISRKHYEVMVEWWKEATGWSRLLGECTPEVESGLEAYQNLARAEACRPSYATSWRAEADQFWHSADEAAQASCCGDLPLLVISQDPKSPRSPQAISVRPIWNNLQEHLKALSSRSWRVIARDSGHAVMIDRPDVVIRGVRQVVACTIPQGCDRKFGSTSVE